MKLILAGLIIFQTTTAFAFSGNSLTWQKLALEEKVQKKFNMTLSSLLKDNQYMVEVEAEVSEPGSPNFGNDGAKTGARVSDLKLAESRGDYIAFSKMGLEVPVVEKFLDEDRTKLMNLYRYNESYDLFKNITDINVTIFLSEKIPAELVEIVKKVVQSSKLSVSGIKPSIKFENIAMEWVDPAELKKAEEAKKEKPELQKKETEPKIWAKDWYEWASRWGNAVGLIFGAIIMGVIALSLFKKWKEFMEAFAAKSQQQNESQNKDKDENENDPKSLAALAAAANSEEDVMSSNHNFERFQQCLAQHPDEATNIVRNWLNDQDESSLLGLRGIAQQVTSEEMEKLLSGLTEYQRNKWKSLLVGQLDHHELVNANKHIFQEVVRSFLVPTQIKDGDLLNLILELSPKATCNFIKAHPTQTGILMNLLSPSVLGRILVEVNEDTAAEWLEEGSAFNVATVDENVPALKELLRSFKVSTAPAPFAQRIMTIIPSSTPAREMTLFRALAKSGGGNMVVEVARKHFPSELILELPTAILKEVMLSYPMAKRIELLFASEDYVRKFLIDVLATEGTPARDLVDMELENIERDPGRGTQIKNRSDDIWFDYVKLTRTTLAKNPLYAEYCEGLIHEWSFKLSATLKLVKEESAA